MNSRRAFGAKFKFDQFNPLPLRTSGLILDSTDLPASANDVKKTPSHGSARRAAVGARTIKSGQSRYKEHSFRLWLSRFTEQMLLVPLKAANKIKN